MHMLNEPNKLSENKGDKARPRNIKYEGDGFQIVDQGRYGREMNPGRIRENREWWSETDPNRTSERKHLNCIEFSRMRGRYE